MVRRPLPTGEQQRGAWPRWAQGGSGGGGWRQRRWVGTCRPAAPGRHTDRVEPRRCASIACRTGPWAHHGCVLRCFGVSALPPASRPRSLSAGRLSGVEGHQLTAQRPRKRELTGLLLNALPACSLPSDSDLGNVGGE